MFVPRTSVFALMLMLAAGGCASTEYVETKRGEADKTPAWIMQRPANPLPLFDRIFGLSEGSAEGSSFSSTPVSTD